MGFLDSLFGSDDTESEIPGEPELPAVPHWATVLLTSPRLLGEQKLREVFAELGHRPQDVEPVEEDVIYVHFRDYAVAVEQRAEPFPQHWIDTQFLPEDYPSGRAHVGVWPLIEDPLQMRDKLRTPTQYPDPWSEAGMVRVLTKFIRAMLQRSGCVVVLNRAGGLAVPAPLFMEKTRGIDDPGFRPFEVWTDFEFDEEITCRKTRGMNVFGLPEVYVEYAHDDLIWRNDRLKDAMWYVASKMVRENRVIGSEPIAESFLGFEPIDDFRVPIGGRSAEEDPDDEDAGDAITYRVTFDDPYLRLESDDPSAIWEKWTGDETEVTLSSYQALVRYTLGKEFGAPPTMSVPVDDQEEIGVFDCDVFRTGPPEIGHMFTNGLGYRPGRMPTKGRRVELVAHPPRDHGAILAIMVECAIGMVQSGWPWNPGDTYAFHKPLHGLQHFVITPETVLEPVDGGPPIHLWGLVPLTPGEYEEVRGGGAAEWLEANDFGFRPQIMSRWMAVFDEAG